MGYGFIFTAESGLFPEVNTLQKKMKQMKHVKLEVKCLCMCSVLKKFFNICIL